MDTKKTDVTAKTTSTNTAAKKAKPSSTKKTGSNTHGTANVGTTVEQEVVGGVDPKIRRKIKLVKEHAEGWEDEDIIRVLEETNFDENLAINNILDGIVSKTGDNWTTFETKKKKVPKQKEVQSHVTEQPRGSRGGRGRGRGRGQSDDNLPPRFQGAGRGSSSHRPGDVGPGARGGKVVPPRQQQQQGEFNNRTNAKRPPEHEGAGVGNGVVQHHVDVTRTYDTSVPGKSLADIVRSGGRSAPPPAVQSAALAQQPQQQQQQQQPQQQPQQQTQHISTTPDISGTQQQQPSSQSQPQSQHISTPSDISSQQATQQSQQAAQQAQLQAQQQAQLQLQAQAQLQAQQAAQQAQIQAQQAAQQAQLQAQQQQESQQAAAQSASSVEQSQPSQQSSSASYPSMSQRYSAPGSTTVWMPKETQSHQPEVPAVSQGQQQPQQQSQQQPQQSQQSQQPTQQPQQTQQQPSQAFNSNVVPIPPSSQSVGNADLSKGMTRGPVVLPGGYTDELHLQFGNLSFGRSDAELAAVSDDNAANGPQGTTDQQTKSQSSESQSQASIPMQVPQGMAHHHLAQPMGAMAGMGSLTGMPDADQPLPMPPYGYMPDPYAGMHYAYDMQGADLARLSQGGRLPMGYYEPYQPAMTAGYRTTQDSKFPQGARSTSPTSLNGTSPATSTVGSGSTRDSSQQSSKQSNQPLSPHQQHAPQHYGSAQYSSVSPPMYGYPPYMANQYASYQPPTQAHQYQLPYQRVQYYKQPGAAPGAYPAMHGGMSTVGYDELAPEYSKGYGLPQHGLHSSFFLPSDPKTSPTPSTPPTSKAQTGFSSSASSSSSTSESTSPATSKYSAQADYKYPSGRDVSQTSYYGASMTNQPAFSQGGQAAFPFMQQPPPHHMMQPQSYQARNYSQV